MAGLLDGKVVIVTEPPRAPAGPSPGISAPRARASLSRTCSTPRTPWWNCEEPALPPNAVRADVTSDDDMWRMAGVAEETFGGVTA